LQASLRLDLGDANVLGPVLDEASNNACAFAGELMMYGSPPVLARNFLVSSVETIGTNHL
jgi:hypothetical protein